MTTFTTLRTLLSKFGPDAAEAPADRDPRGSIRRQAAMAAFRVDGWYNFELDAAHRSIRR